MCKTSIPMRTSRSRWLHSSVDLPFVGASSLAKNLRAAFIQVSRVIVDVHREQARSYIKSLQAL